jgi:hypothetical protein
MLPLCASGHRDGCALTATISTLLVSHFFGVSPAHGFYSSRPKLTVETVDALANQAHFAPEWNCGVARV